MSRNQEFDSKAVLVSGGGTGMGRAAAIEFARRGAAVVVADIDPTAAQETVAAVEGDGGRALAVRADVREDDDARQMVQAAVDAYGGLHVAVNAAGITGPAATVGEYTTEDWDNVVAVNLRGMFFAMRHELRQMRTQEGPRAIVNISSVMGLTAAGDYPAYAASKHGVVGLTKSAAVAEAKAGIRINAICPGSVRTPMWERTRDENPERIEEWREKHPIGRIGEPEEIAQTLVWLASEASSFVTGVALPVDGGMLAKN